MFAAQAPGSSSTMSTAMPRASAARTGGVVVACDASTKAGVELLIGTARELAGPIDVYCANAGVARAGLVDVAENAWEVSCQVNVMAHVRASRAFIPQWVSQGHGMFVSTVSAAGLLTIPGAAPYAVTKHGAYAYAYAEWLFMTYARCGRARACRVPAGSTHADVFGLGAGRQGAHAG